MDQDWDWVRLGQALKAARKAEGIAKQEHMAAALGVGRSTIQMIERGHSYSKIQPTHRAFAQRVGWTAESVQAVLEGGPPELRNEPEDSAESAEPQAPVTAEGTRLPLRIVDELSDNGPLLDTTVIQLGGDARMVVVIKGKPDASPEEIRRNLEAWRRAQPHLEALTSPLGEDEGAAANGS
jgi:transcriptional regulator with XRE-family HTH domain